MYHDPATSVAYLRQPQGLLLVFLSLVGEPPHAGLRAEEEGQAGGRTQWLVRVLLQDEF